MKEITFIEAKELALRLMVDHGVGHWNFEWMDTGSTGGQCCPTIKVCQWSDKRSWKKWHEKFPDAQRELIDGKYVYAMPPILKFSRPWIVKYGRDTFVDTVLHEIAHALMYERKIPHKRSHGKEWAELAFSIGVRDKEFGGRWGLRGMAYAANRKPKPEPTEADKKLKEKQKKLAHAQKMAKQTATRIKRLQTALKKWERRVRFYSK